MTVIPSASPALLKFAVTDGPDGTTARALTDDRADALRLKAQFRFWCSRAVDGCGGSLAIAAGEVVRPYFRHLRSEDSASCTFIEHPELVERNYEHLLCQLDLVAWLADQGMAAKIEHTFDDKGGRADLHVMVEQRAQSIEVQLSPIGDQQWLDRDAKYQRHVGRVNWLYGQGAEGAAAREQALRGTALSIRRSARGVKIMIYGDRNQTWSPLADCRMMSAGIWTPELERVRQDSEERATEDAHEQRNARVRQEREAHEARNRQHWRSEGAGGSAKGLSRDQVAREATAIRADRAKIQGENEQRWAETDAVRPLEAMSNPLLPDAFPEAAEWVDSQNWQWLDGLDIPVPNAQFIAYVVSCIYFNGTIDMLGMPESVQTQRLLTALQDAGIITLSTRLGYRRWERRQEAS